MPLRKRLPDPWGALLERARYRTVDVAVDSVPHPSTAGAYRSAGAPRGQTEDWRFPAFADGAGAHVQRFGRVWRLHIDQVHPAVSLVGHLRADVLRANGDEWEAARRELFAVMVRNLDFPGVRLGLGAWSSPADGMRWMRDELGYRFNPRFHVVDLWTAQRRRWAACSEAAAGLLAWAYARSIRRDTYAGLETLDGTPGYGHVIAVVAGERFDVYAEASFKADGFSRTWPLP